MELFYRENNGRPIYNDDFALLQNELFEAAKGSLKNRNAFILNGCVVTGTGPYNISAGLVFVNNDFMRFQGVTGVSLPYYIYQDAIQLTTYDQYQDNVSRPTRQLVQAIGSNSLPGSGEYITMTSGGGRLEADARSTEYVRTVGSQNVAGNKTFAGNNTYSGVSTFTGTINSLNNNSFSATNTFNSVINVNNQNLSGSLTGGGVISISNTIAGTRLISTVPNGTEPLSISSTTRVSNLNVEYLSGFNYTYLIPTGGIIMWSGSFGSIPVGWFLCNGANGTPDLRNRFVVGAGYSYNVGDTGGEDTHTLSINEMPFHNHTFQTGGDNHVDDTPGGYVLGRQNSDSRVANYSTTYAGSNQPHENRPPYYALAYIMKG